MRLLEQLGAEVPYRPEQPQPDDLVGVGHRDQRGEVGGGRPHHQRPKDRRAVGRGSLEDVAQLAQRGRTERGQVGANVGVFVEEDQSSSGPTLTAGCDVSERLRLLTWP